MTDNSELRIEQRHRDAAAGLFLDMQGEPSSAWDHGRANDLRSGDLDDDDFVQAFARFEAHHMAPAEADLAAMPVATPAADRGLADEEQRIFDKYVTAQGGGALAKIPRHDFRAAIREALRAPASSGKDDVA